MDTILLAAFLDGQPTTECAFSASIDGGPAVPATAVIAGSGIIPLPVGAQNITLQAVPTSLNHWPLSGQFQLQGTGNLVAINAPAEFAPPRAAATATDSLILVSVHLSRVRDATDKVLASLASVPQIRQLSIPPNWPPQTVNQPAGTWPPTAWDTPELDDFNYINTPPLAGQDLQTTALSLAPATDDIVLELSNVDAPQTIAVSWPSGVPRDASAGPTPFMLYFHPNVAQNALPNPSDPNSPYYVNPLAGTAYPFGFDFVFYGLWRYLNFQDDPLTADPFCKGLPYQLAAAGKNAVIVLPCNRVNPDLTAPEIGVFRHADSAEKILRDIQGFMFRRAGVYSPPELGRTALGSFSAGNFLVTNFLTEPANQKEPFYLDTLQELYAFDPQRAGERWISAALAWAGKGDNANKMIRLYSQSPITNLGALVTPQALPASTPFLMSSSDGLRTAALLPGPAWNKAATAAGNPNMAGGTSSSVFQDTHQLISAMMLTDALARSGF